jgi:hypothetical protein
VSTFHAERARRQTLEAIAYIAGGTIMNILHHELPDTDRSGDVVVFAAAATVYGVLLLSLSPTG